MTWHSWHSWIWIVAVGVAVISPLGGMIARRQSGLDRKEMAVVRGEDRLDDA
jgi:hypothetical protein